LFMHCMPLGDKNKVLANIAMDFVINEVFHDIQDLQLHPQSMYRQRQVTTI
jgi:hypothetical protein